MQRLAFADEFEAQWKRAADEYIHRAGLDVLPEPEDPEAAARNRYDGEIITSLNLREAGITTVLWATGFSYDLSRVEIPVFDETGFPRQRRGITACPGLYFLGMNWLELPRSAFVGAAGKEALVIAEDIEQGATSHVLPSGRVSDQD